MRSRKTYFLIFAVIFIFLGTSMEHLLWAQVEKEKLLFREIPVGLGIVFPEELVQKATEVYGK